MKESAFFVFVAFALGFVGALVTGCATTLESEYQPRIDQIISDAQSNTWVPYCPPPKDSPKTRCGLISDQVSLEGYQKFSAQHCAGIKPEECTQKMSKMITAQQRLRYTHANWEQVLTMCDAYPDKCDTTEKQEVLLMKTHNDGVYAAARAKLKALNEERSIDEAHESIRRASAIKAFGDGVAPSRTTSCTSQPNGLGGFSTRCQ